MNKNINYNLFDIKDQRSIPNSKNRRAKIGSVLGIPVLILDKKTNELFEYPSISEAARSFDTYPKAIWRKAYGDKLYLGRYQINVKNNSYNQREYNIHLNADKYLYNLTYTKYFRCIFNNIMVKSKLISYILLSLILVIIIFIFFYYIIWLYKDICNEYVTTMQRIKFEHSKYLMEHNFIFKNNLINTNRISRPTFAPYTVNKVVDMSVELESRYVCMYKNLISKFGIYQSIINEVNLDFNNSQMGSFHNALSISSSPIIERIDLNRVFTSLVTNTIYESVTNDSLLIKGNRNSLTLDTSINLLQDRSQSKELLNYQSNILYLLINKLSPSIY